MNIQKREILNVLNKNGFCSQRKLAKETGYSVGKVNSAIRELIGEQMIDEKCRLTDRAIKEREMNRPKNAVILAAGYGMRMVPINVEEPKGLLEVKGETLIERMIRQLREAGVQTIDVVVGFMKEKYEYLIDDYDVNLVYNKEYGMKNNLHSLNCVSEKLGNTYIVPCDVWCEDNPFSSCEWYSWYMVTEHMTEKSSVKIGRGKELVSIKNEETGNQMIGISYITEEDAEVVRRKLGEYCKLPEYDQVFWETVLFAGGEIEVGAKVIESDKVAEINTYEQLRELDENSNQLQSNIMELLGRVLNTSPSNITDIKSLKKGMTNRSFEFWCDGNHYIMIIPGEGTDKLINRKNEAVVYNTLKGKGITDPICYISEDNGFKLTEFVEDARTCDPENVEDLKRCMKFLRQFHDENVQVDHTFDLFGQIEYYESLWNGQSSCYRNYTLTKQKMYELKKFIDRQEKQIALTHIDAVPDNFLIKGDDTYLIDWEYAGMQDVHVDVAMFCIYSLYDRSQVDQLIDIYFEGKTEKSVRLKIYSYIAVCGLLWSNWCEYKRFCGVEFGEYSLRQYRYAKDYYRIVKEELNGEF